MICKLSNRLVCRFCGNKFAGVGPLRRHLNNFHGRGKQFRCHICHARFVARQDLVSHERVHEKLQILRIGTVYVCQTCGRHANREDLFRIHLQVCHHLLSPPQQSTDGDVDTSYASTSDVGDFDNLPAASTFTYKCDQCNALFKSLTCLRAHLSRQHKLVDKTTSSGKKRNKRNIFDNLCPHSNCNQLFRDFATLEIHYVKVHLQIQKPFQCCFCKKMFANESPRNYHELSCIKISQIPCGFCDLQIFSSVKSRIDHLKKEHQKLLFECELCDYFAVNQHQFDLHCRHHCQHCGKYHFILHHLRKHIVSCQNLSKNASTEPEPLSVDSHSRSTSSSAWFVCDRCGCRRSRNDLFQLHLQICSRSTDSSSTDHVSSSPVDQQLERCQICSSLFLSTNGLNQHIQQYHLKKSSNVRPRTSHLRLRKFDCIHSECNDKFFDRVAMELHYAKMHLQIPTPLQCQFCGKRSGNITFINMHENVCKLKGSDFKCLNCQNTFETVKQLVIHLRSDHNLKVFECQHCSFYSTRERLAAIHLSHHCLNCKKYLQTIVALQNHIQSQVCARRKQRCRDRTVFQCRFCCSVDEQQTITNERTFANVSTRNQHELEEHGIRCCFCERKYLPNAIQTHKLRKHAIYKCCNGCPLRFCTLEEMQTHKSKCKELLKQFYDEKGAKFTRKRVGNKDRNLSKKCFLCGHCFKNARLLAEHNCLAVLDTDTFLFRCQRCQQQFDELDFAEHRCVKVEIVDNGYGDNFCVDKKWIAIDFGVKMEH